MAPFLERELQVVLVHTSFVRRRTVGSARTYAYQSKGCRNCLTFHRSTVIVVVLNVLSLGSVVRLSLDQ